MKISHKSLGKVILANIRKALLELGSATKVELSEKLDISFPTISKFLAQMEKDGEVILVGLDDSSGGRRAQRYMYNPDYMLGLAIFLEKTETSYAIFNCAGEVKEQKKTSSVLKDNDGIKLLVELIENIMNKNQSKIGSIAIGVPGSVDNGRIFYIPGYDQYRNINLKEYLENHFTMPVIVENDMNAAVLGYHYHQRIPKNQSLVYLYFGNNGPGAGFMINGDVVRGNTFFAGEISLIPQYNGKNFGQALDSGDQFSKVRIENKIQMDAISRLVATIASILNPKIIVFSRNEVDEGTMNQIAKGSSKYIPREHLPELRTSDWEQDYLYGLQNLCIQLMLNEK